MRAKIVSLLVRLLVGIGTHGGAARFFLALMPLVGEQAKLGAARASSFLPAQFGDPPRLVSRGAGDARFNLVEEKRSCQIAIERLGALFLTFDPNPRRPMAERDAGRELVDALPAGAGGADELLVDVLLLDAEGAHALEQLFLFFGPNRKHSYRRDPSWGRRI